MAHDHTSPHHSNFGPDRRAPASFTVIALIILAGLMTPGCEPGDQQTDADHPQPADPSPDAVSAYRLIDGSRVALMPQMTDDAQLAAAIDLARATLGDAMHRWQGEPDAQQARAQWAIKWAAATINGGHEHLWIRPTGWTEHRIEGVLLSKPTAELLMARTAGEVVSFPPDDVTDWVHVSSDSDKPLEGGYTLALIESRARAGQ